MSLKIEDLIEKLADARRGDLKLTYDHEGHSWTAELDGLKGRSCSSGGAVEALHRSMKRDSNGPKIGIMGFGIIGDALRYSLEERPEFLGSFVILDPNIEEYKNTEISEFSGCMFVFVCVPTPPNEDGSQDISIVDTCLTQLKDIEYKGIVVLRSTITPINAGLLAKKFDSLRLVTNPEFLTERTARADADNASFYVIGSDDSDAAVELLQFYKDYWPKSSIITTTLRAAMFMKHLTNNWFALKVAFMNEAYGIWNKLVGDDKDEADWEEIRILLSMDDRVGYSHTQVPGPDGKFGFGGKCFPKDSKALVKMAEELEVPLDTIRTALAVNDRVREPEES